MSELIDRSEFLKATALLAAAGAIALNGAGPVLAQAQGWEANLGKVKDLNEKEPVLVKAQFKNAEGELMDEEKVYVRWEKINKSVGRWVILSAFCTHLKCVIEYSSTDSCFQCPCHGSQFDLEGGVINRPAKQPLADYSEQAEERDGSLFLKRDAS
jgi:Rieske Fe-S protein